MAVERKLAEIGPLLFTSNGTTSGVVTVADTKGFKVKARVTISATSLPNLNLEIKRVLSKTQLIVGAPGNILFKTDISLYTVALNSTIHQPEQDRPGIPTEQHERAVYEEEPTLAKRVFIVDEYGNPYDIDNPFPTTSAGEGSSKPNMHGLTLLNIPDTSTEVSFTFPNNTKYYQIRVRDSKDVIKVGLTSGAIDLGNFWTVLFGNIHSPEKMMDFVNGYTLYFKCKHKNNVTLEIMYYYKV
jgi:hypothetical protein